MAVVLCLATFPGNLLVCIAILKDPYKELKNSFNCFVLQLALSDLVVGTVTEPLFIVFHTREAMGYPVMQNVWVIHLSFFISYTASLLSLAALTLDRYLNVMSYYKRILSTNTVTLISVLIWVISISLSCLYFLTGFIILPHQHINVFVRPYSPETQITNISLDLVSPDSDKAKRHVDGKKSQPSVLHYFRNIRNLFISISGDDIHH